MTHENLIAYLLWQTKRGINQSRYSEYVIDWLIEPYLKVQKDGELWGIESCDVWIVLKNGTSLKMEIPSLFGQDICEVYNDDIINRYLDAKLYQYFKTKDGKLIEP